MHDSIPHHPVQIGFARGPKTIKSSNKSCAAPKPQRRRQNSTSANEGQQSTRYCSHKGEEKQQKRVSKMPVLPLIAPNWLKEFQNCPMFSFASIGSLFQVLDVLHGFRQPALRRQSIIIQYQTVLCLPRHTTLHCMQIMQNGALLPAMNRFLNWSLPICGIVDCHNQGLQPM